MNHCVPPEMGADRVHLQASPRRQQPLPGQPQRQDGRAHRGGLQPEPQPAVEVHPQPAVIGAALDPRREVEHGRTRRQHSEDQMDFGGKKNQKWNAVPLSLHSRGAAGTRLCTSPPPQHSREKEKKHIGGGACRPQWSKWEK